MWVIGVCERVVGVWAGSGCGCALGVYGRWCGGGGVCGGRSVWAVGNVWAIAVCGWTSCLGGVWAQFEGSDL